MSCINVHKKGNKLLNCYTQLKHKQYKDNQRLMMICYCGDKDRVSVLLLMPLINQIPIPLLTINPIE